MRQSKLIRNLLGSEQSYICNRWVGQDLCVPNVCPRFDVDKDQVRYTSFQGLTFTNSCTTSKELGVRVKMSLHI